MAWNNENGEMEWQFIEIKTCEEYNSFIEYIISFFKDMENGGLPQNSFTSLVFYCEAGDMIDNWSLCMGADIPALKDEFFRSELELLTGPEKLVIPVSKFHLDKVKEMSKVAYESRYTPEEILSCFFSLGIKEVMKRQLISNEAIHAINPGLPEKEHRIDFKYLLPYCNMWNKIGFVN